MLRTVRIRNIAIAEDMVVEFGDGLNVITGDSGAGKSILLRALRLVMGARAEQGLIRAGTDCAVVEAVLDGDAVTGCGGTLCVRRELWRNRRSRAFVDGRAVSLTELRALFEGRITVCSQHDHHSVLSSDQHLAVLDRYGGLESWVRRLAQHHEVLSATLHHLSQLRTRSEAARAQKRELQIKIDELQDLHLSAGEVEQLVLDVERVRHGAMLVGAASDGMRGLDHDEDAVCDRLAKIRTELSRASRHDPVLEDLAERVGSARLELHEVARDLSDYVQRVGLEPLEATRVEQRLTSLRAVARRHDVEPSQLWCAIAQYQTQLDGYESLADDVEAAQTEAESLRSELEHLCAVLSQQRHVVACAMAEDVCSALVGLGLQGAQFVVDVAPVKSGGLHVGDRCVTSSGSDRVEFWLSVNAGEPPLPLGQVASGGELARVLFALSVAVGLRHATGAQVYDEVDVGLSGPLASALGMRMAELAARRQVVCVTHAPQIAAYAQRHLHVHKVVRLGRTYSEIELLTGRQRETELARMLGAERPTGPTLAAARELLLEACGPKAQAPAAR